MKRIPAKSDDAQLLISTKTVELLTVPLPVATNFNTEDASRGQGFSPCTAVRLNMGEGSLMERVRNGSQ
jgi:hypothetical protein